MMKKRKEENTIEGGKYKHPLLWCFEGEQMILFLTNTVYVFVVLDPTNLYYENFLHI